MTQASIQHDLPEYENPPLHEVVCGILFQRLDKVLNPYLGLLWEQYKPEYSQCLEVVPLIPVMESFDTPSPLEPQMDLEAPLLPRTWFVHANGNGVIQVQRDRFLHNWRKIRPDDAYPRYQSVIRMFPSHLSRFIEFLKENNLGIVIPLQYELTYMNHIMQGEGWESLSDVEKVFPNFSWQRRKDSMLPSPESLQWQTNFVLPNHIGRLHTKLQNAHAAGMGAHYLYLN